MKRPPISLAVIRLIVLAVILISATATFAVIGTEGISELFENATESRLGLLALSGLIILGVVLMVPGTIGTFTAGLLLGFVVGFPVAYISALIGSILAFFISKAVGKEGMQELLGDRMDSIDDWLLKNDFVSILILRLLPIVPFNGLNYAAGLTRVRTSRYIAASAIGIAPGSALSSFAASSSTDMTSTPFLIAAGLLIFFTVVSLFVARRFTNSRTPPAS